MADRGCHNSDIVWPLPPPPPPPIKNFNEAKELKKSPASLLGKENVTTKKTAEDICTEFIRFNTGKNESWSGILWIFYNNDVEACLQDGPTCGLVALKMAADILRKSGRSIADNCSVNEVDNLLKLAQDCGYSYEGEMFSARDLADLAKKYYGTTYQVVQNGIEDFRKLARSIVRGYPVILPYDCDKNNEPCMKSGHNSHWAIITGFLLGITDTKSPEGNLIIASDSNIPTNIDGDKTFLITRHGKSRHYGIWSWQQSYSSNNNLTEFDSDGTATAGRTCLLTEGIKHGLCSKSLFFYPQI